MIRCASDYYIVKLTQSWTLSKWGFFIWVLQPVWVNRTSVFKCFSLLKFQCHNLNIIHTLSILAITWYLQWKSREEPKVLHSHRSQPCTKKKTGLVSQTQLTPSLQMVHRLVLSLQGVPGLQMPVHQVRQVNKHRPLPTTQPEVVWQVCECVVMWPMSLVTLLLMAFSSPSRASPGPLSYGGLRVQF